MFYFLKEKCCLLCLSKSILYDDPCVICLMIRNITSMCFRFSLDVQIILSQEKNIQRLNELVRSLREEVQQCRSNNETSNQTLSLLTRNIIALEQQQILEDWTQIEAIVPLVVCPVILVYHTSESIFVPVFFPSYKFLKPFVHHVEKLVKFKRVWSKKSQKRSDKKLARDYKKAVFCKKVNCTSYFLFGISENVFNCLIFKFYILQI